ncbi:hypothetical protein [Streptomyces mirabilis]|uniref:hypothetical protein n=1 Tax=Streptomyces mirabilis TaxID=68239 RepID=UPI0036CCEFF3
MPIRIRLEGGSGGKTIVTRRQLSHGHWKLIEPNLPTGEYGPYPERLAAEWFYLDTQPFSNDYATP